MMEAVSTSGWKFGADDELGALGIAVCGEIHFRRGRRFEAADADIGDDADDGAGIAIKTGDGATDGTLAGPVKASGGFVDDDVGAVLENVLPGNVAAFDEVDAHGVQIAGSDDANNGGAGFVLPMSRDGLPMPQLRSRSRGSMSATPAASTPGRAFTAARICWSEVPIFSPLGPES